MREQEASRTLVKSPPELWSECSDADALARHLEFAGEITITRLEPETTVAWEGEHARGTVQIEPSGWGTRVTLRAATEKPQSESPPPLEVRTEPPPPRRHTLAWLKTFFLGESVGEDPAPTGEPAAAGADPDLVAALDGALDSLGQAHHRPYSRA